MEKYKALLEWIETHRRLLDAKSPHGNSDKAIRIEMLDKFKAKIVAESKAEAKE
jgi:hypothetical protein